MSDFEQVLGTSFAASRKRRDSFNRADPTRSRAAADSVAAAELEFESILSSFGVRAALRFLNGRARYRFTGVFRVEPSLLRNVYLFDRENPDLDVGGDTHLLRDTYCSIVGATRSPFMTADSMRDRRLTRHPAREKSMSYCGVPIRRADGTPFGVLCHFDPRPPSQRERGAVAYPVSPLT